ncbi:MAG: hypothetical protein WC608_05580 [Parcubacteria group bacterium]
MDGEKKFDGLMKFVAAAYLLVVFGYIEIAAAAYLLVLLGWIAKELIGGFIIGQRERREHKEFKEREKAWKTEENYAGNKAGERPALAEESSENVVLDPL